MKRPTIAVVCAGCGRTARRYRVPKDGQRSWCKRAACERKRNRDRMRHIREGIPCDRRLLNWLDSVGNRLPVIDWFVRGLRRSAREAIADAMRRETPQ